MTIATTFHSWQTNGAPGGPYDRASPNLLEVQRHLEELWPFLTPLGCFATRPVRGSTTLPSTHSWGAAIDIGFPAEQLAVVQADICPHLVGYSLELGIDAIHDYRGCRIWRAGRTDDVRRACDAWWKAQRRSSATGMGMTWGNHLHLETGPSTWGDGSPVAGRLA